MKNVILFTIDTLRKDVLGCYGGEGGLTPFIDSIQDKCIRFENAQSTGPYTQASFPSILTSTYYLEHIKEEKRKKRLSKKRTLISEILSFRDILTAAFHSNAYLMDVFGWNRGWDTFFDSSDEQVDDKVPYIKASQLNNRVISWFLAEQKKLKEKPFFLWLHYMDVHEPYVPERKYIDKIDPSIDVDEDQMMKLFHEVLLKRDISDPKNVELFKKLYLAHVIEVDDATKEFFGILRKAKHLNDSIVIITADHGDEFGEHGSLSHDGKMYSELIDVPLFIYDPSLEKGVVSDKVVSTIDVCPTIAHLFGLGNIAQFQGHSLLPLEDYPDKGVFGETLGKHGSTEEEEPRGVFFYRDGDLKIIYSQENDSWELYDLKEDSKELNNIVDKSPSAESMREKLMPRINWWTTS
jgi:arylsulfatase A-like enzyme